MADEKEKIHRKVFMLPSELVDRIAEYQNEKGLPSEVEAVRRLLDEALMTRDTHNAVIRRILNKLDTLRIPAEAAKDIIVGHPLVKEISFPKPDIIRFVMAESEGDFKIEIRSNKDVLVADNWSTWEHAEPWVDPDRKVASPNGSRKKATTSDLDDDIPF